MLLRKGERNKYKWDNDDKVPFEIIMQDIKTANNRLQQYFICIMCLILYSAACIWKFKAIYKKHTITENMAGLMVFLSLKTLH